MLLQSLRSSIARVHHSTLSSTSYSQPQCKSVAAASFTFRFYATSNNNNVDSTESMITKLQKAKSGVTLPNQKAPEAPRILYKETVEDESLMRYISATVPINKRSLNDKFFKPTEVPHDGVTCYFCRKMKELKGTPHQYRVMDTMNLPLWRKFVNAWGFILPRAETGTCARHQRKVARSVKRALHMGLTSHKVAFHYDAPYTPLDHTIYVERPAGYKEDECDEEEESVEEESLQRQDTTVDPEFSFRETEEIDNDVEPWDESGNPEFTDDEIAMVDQVFESDPTMKELYKLYTAQVPENASDSRYASLNIPKDILLKLIGQEEAQQQQKGASSTEDELEDLTDQEELAKMVAEAAKETQAAEAAPEDKDSKK